MMLLLLMMMMMMLMMMMHDNHHYCHSCFLVLVLGHRLAFKLFIATELIPDKLEGNSTLKLPSLKLTANATENGWE